MNHRTLSLDDAYLSPPALADLLDTSAGQLAKLRMRGEGPPFVKLGRPVRYQIGDVRRWAETQNSSKEA